MLLHEKLTAMKRGPLRAASILAIGMVLIASGVHASPVGLQYDVNFDDFGVVGGADLDQTVTFDGTTKTIGDVTLSEQARLLPDGTELIEFNISASQPLVDLSSNTRSDWRIGFDNIVYGDGLTRQRSAFILGFTAGGSYITASPLTQSFVVGTHPIDGHPIISLIPQHPSLPGPGDNVGASSGGFATFDSLLDIYIGDATLAEQIDGIQIAMVVPEPGTALLMGLGLAGLAGSRRRRA